MERYVPVVYKKKVYKMFINTKKIDTQKIHI